MVSLPAILQVFLKIGTLGFGGPFALLALMEKEVVGRKGWLTPAQFAESTAIGTLTPGPIFFAAAVHVGYRLRGVPGAVTAATASLAPAFLLTVGFDVFYVEVEKAPVVAGLSRGITAAVVGLLATVTLSTARSLVRDGAGVLIGVASFAALELLGLNPVWAILGAAGLGLLAYRDAKGGPGPCSGASS